MKNQDTIQVPRWAFQALENYDSAKFAAFLTQYNNDKIDLYKEKDATYGGSWQKDGLVSAFLNLKRKIDRLINMWQNGDIFNFGGKGESILDTFQDMENYSALCVGFIIFSIKSEEQYDATIPQNSAFRAWIKWEEQLVFYVGGKRFAVGEPKIVVGVDLADSNPASEGVAKIHTGCSFCSDEEATHACCNSVCPLKPGKV